MKTFGERLSSALLGIGMKRHGAGKRLADLTGVTVKAANKWLNDETIPSRKNLESISKETGVRIEWLEYGVGNKYDSLSAAQGSSTNGRIIPIRGMAKMGHGGYYEELANGELGFVEIQTSDPNAFALKAVGDSMSPAIKNGVIVVCNTQWTAKKGDDVAICKTNYEKLIKEFISDQDGIVELKSVNGDEILRIPKKDILTMYVVSHKCHPNNIRELL